MRRGAASAALRGRRILIIHSGGDSRRLPAFAALGKAFAPLPVARVGGGPAAVFDLVLADLLALPPSGEGDVFVASGDAVVGAGREAIDCSGDGVVGISQVGSIERGSRHGVYVATRAGGVRDFLQKPTSAKARAAGAVIGDDSVLIDTGIVRFSPSAAESLLHAFLVRPSRRPSLLDLVVDGKARPVDLYLHVLTALVPGLTSAEFRRRLGIGTSDPDRRALAVLRDVLGRVPFSVRRSATMGFLHLGTTRECLDLLLRDGRTSRRYGLEAPSSPLRTIGTSGGRVKLTRGARAAVIGCLDARLRLGGENLVFGLPRGTTSFDLPHGFGCVALPIGSRQWATLLFHLQDDAKSPLTANPAWAGTRFADFVARAAIRVGMSGPAESATLWDARLWRITPSPTIEPWMFGRRAPTAGDRAAKRYSIAELLERVNHERAVGLERDIAMANLAKNPGDLLHADDRLGADVLRELAGAAGRGKLAVALVRDGRRRQPLLRARSLATAGRLLGGTAELQLRSKALAAVGEAVAEELALPQHEPKAAIRPDETVWTSAPARIDLAGGWSDTPPICQERGGVVVNLAIDLDNRPPVNAIAKLADRPVITIHSVDLGEHRTITSSAELFAHRDPRDWTALAKAALRIAGIAPPSPTVRLDRWLTRFGGGISLSLLAAVPKGSGLGTSSILGATVLACLDRVVGRRPTLESLVARTSLLEQMIATRGGWQDQIGGLEPGLKIARSAVGPVQRPVVERIALSAAFEREIADRTVLCYTGRRRMARDILERVVERYLARDSGVLGIIEDLKNGAERMRTGALAGDLDAFALEMSRYWSLKVRLDPLAMTPEIAAMAAAFEREVIAWTLPGAGGGGFLFFIAKDRAAAMRIRRSFQRHPMHPLARAVEWSIAGHGLRSGSV
ncbi:MAG: hypothetical protein JNL80_02000 [Phycisphaerae bacterium]|nr:hypothetical protein [Phycisphaerae bacterium]